MEALAKFWSGLDWSRRIGFLAGLAMITVFVGTLGYWTLRTEYRVLFSELASADLSAMAAELDKMKVPYKVGPEGNSLLVPEPSVHKTRVALMGRELPLHGAVGFELFNNMEFGVSEFVQKVNFQRALQGELTRTILAIDEVQSARVHLALAEQSLFRKDQTKSKASVSITTKPGRLLSPVQVQGIQRLVAASVNEVQSPDVTVLDQHGVALSRASQGEGNLVDGAAAQLDMKRGVEGYLTQKAGKVLDQMFGGGEAVVSVDATLATEQSKVTTEEILSAKGGDPAQPAAGVLTRERQTTRDAGGDGARGDSSTVTNLESDYQNGRRTEQIVSPAGGVKQLSVAVVVKRSLSEVELQRVRDLVAASVGLSRSRGDVITVHSMEQLRTGVADQPEGVSDHLAAPTSGGAATPRDLPSERLPVIWLVAGFALLVVLLFTLGVLVRLKTARRPRVAALALEEGERTRVLHSVQQWLGHESATSTATVAPSLRQQGKA